MSGVDKKALSLIGGKHKRYNHQKANMVVPRLYLLRANHRCWTDYGQTGWLRITRYLSGTNKEAATLIGGKHKGYNRGRPTWLYRGSTSYEQTEWLRNALLVKRISCLVSQTESVGSQRWRWRSMVPWLQSAAMPSRMPGTQVKNIHLDKATLRVDTG